MAKEQIRTILGSNLRKYRNLREWSQMELAEKADISMNFLSEIERGNKWPHPETLQNIAAALNVDVFELFRSEPSMTKNKRDLMNSFSNDVITAVEQSVKKALSLVKKQYRG
ncbi:MAG: helix-turn-helix domain-containing protein [Treponema sp.]|jgi:transcriptional regulator with XRE-family HTH domain|nr:helix-turn-helix domain-containing protein [Treponema sp.]